VNEHKSEKLRQIALDNNWQSIVKPCLETFTATGNVDDILWTLYCVRGEEKIKAVWRGNRFRDSVYTYGAYRTCPARSGGVIRFLKGEPDHKKLAAASAVIKVNYEQLKTFKNVPWEDSDTVPAFDVLVGVVGKDITWVRKRDGSVKTENCPKSSNVGKPHFKLKTTIAGRRVLEWSNSFGFQACYLDDIIDVN